MDEKFNSLSKFNLQDGYIPSPGFLRKGYVNKIFDQTGNKLIKVLMGLRRAGKKLYPSTDCSGLIDGG